MSEISADIFKAYDIRGKVGTELTKEVAWSIGCALADWLPMAGPVAVGYDMRPDSKDLADALIEGLRLQGRDVALVGQVTTDMLYFTVGSMQLAGGAMITASHNGAEYNGIKIVREEVKMVGLDTGLNEVRDSALAGNFVPAAEKGALIEYDMRDKWLDHALSFVEPNQWPHYHLAIDTGNGMVGLIAPILAERLPRLQIEGMYYELDGSFPHHEANPQKPENVADLVAAVTEKKLDFGIAFDGDGDRAGFVDDKGRPVLGTDLISIVARHYLQKYPGAEIVHDVRTSRATQELIREWGGMPVRTKAGRVSIGTVMRQRGAKFGAETTGHMFFVDNFNADSGLIAALVVIQALAESGKKLSELVDAYRRYVMTPELNFEVSDKAAALERLRNTFQDGDQDELDGLTVSYATSWFNVRTSNTEPVMRLNAEASSAEELDRLIERVSAIITE